MNNFDYLFKYICIGDVSVGKSCIIKRYTYDQFIENYDSTIGVEFSQKVINVKDSKNQTKIIKTQIWDTAGQENFKSITRNYYKGSIGALLVFDISNRKSFQNIQQWVNEIQSVAHNQIQLILVGNKIDLSLVRREISVQEAEEYAQSLNISYLECSAKTNNNIQEIFYALTKQIINKIDQNQIDLNNNYNGIKLGKKSNSVQNDINLQDSVQKSTEQQQQEKIKRCQC